MPKLEGVMRMSKKEQVIVWAQDPEDCDEQGVYLKVPGEDDPWQTERDAEEFDAIIRPEEYPDYIRNIESAQKFINYLYGGDGLKVISLKWWNDG